MSYAHGRIIYREKKLAINQVILEDMKAAQWKNAFTCFYEVTFLYSLGIVECCIPSKLRAYLLDYMQLGVY